MDLGQAAQNKPKDRTKAFQELVMDIDTTQISKIENDELLQMCKAALSVEMIKYRNFWVEVNHSA